MSKDVAKKKLGELSKHVWIVGMLLLAFVPFYLMIVISFKDNAQFSQHPFTPTWPLHLENWRYGWDVVHSYIANTVIVVVLSVVGTLTWATLTAYVFGRYDIPFGKVLFSALLALMFFPSVSNLVPLFVLCKHLGLLNTLWVLIIPGMAGGQVVCIYVLKNFIADIPKGLFDAAKVDGANDIQQIWHIVVPMSGPILSTLAIMQFVRQWNNYVWPLIVIRDQRLLTVTVGIAKLAGEYRVEWGPMMAAYSVAAVPLVILFVFTMRIFIRGLSSGAIKG